MCVVSGQLRAAEGPACQRVSQTDRMHDMSASARGRSPSFPLVAERVCEPPRQTNAVDEPALVRKEPHLKLRRNRALGEERLASIGRAEEGDMRVVLKAH